jgi:glucose-1-phosphate thymidylyltransferase
MNTKGIILAGGSGKRLWPITSTFSKHFVPIYDKPMIYYPLTTLILCGIKDFLMICTKEDIVLYQKLLGNGKDLGIEINYQIQEQPNGIAEALILAEDFLSGQSSVLILGDNFIHGKDLGRNLEKFITSNGASITSYYMADVSQYGVVIFNQNDSPVEIIEKPTQTISNWAIPGIYFYDSSASKRARELKPSVRGELEISDLNKSYLKDGLLTVHKLPRGSAWLDLGSPLGILEASNYVKIMQDRQGILIGSPHEACSQMGLVKKADIVKNLKNRNSKYAFDIKFLLN